MALSKSLILVPLAAVLLAAGCGGAQQHTTTADQAPAKQGGILNVLWSGDVDSIDPGQTYYSGGYLVTNVTQRTPIAYAPGKPDAIADLATELPKVSADGKTVT